MSGLSGAAKAARFATLLAIALMFVLVADELVPQANDDAFIFLRYADNVASGLGPVFNAGERVEGFSSPLWVALLAIARRITWRGALDPIVVAQYASMACALAAYAGVLAFLRDAGARSSVLLIAALAFFLSPLTFVWGRSAMDGMLAAALLVWTPVVLERARRRRRRSTTIVAGLVLGLLVVSRPEGPAWAAFALVASSWRRSTRSFARPLWIVLVTVTVVTIVVRFAYFGALFPNTAAAKMSVGGAFWLRGLAYVADYLVHVCPLAVPLGLYAASRRDDVLARTGLALVAGALVVVVAESGDFLWFWRLCAPTWPLAVALMGLGFERLLERGLAGKLVAAAGAVSVVFMQGRASMDGDLAMRAAGLDASLRQDTELGKALADVFLPGESFVVGPLGRIVYYARPTRAWDVWGLVVPEIARSPRVPGKVGHERHAAAVLVARRPTFVMFAPTWLPGPPCHHVDAGGHGQALGDDFVPFEHDPDYVVAYVEHPRKPLFAPLLVRADALTETRARRLHRATERCGASP